MLLLHHLTEYTILYFTYLAYHNQRPSRQLRHVQEPRSSDIMSIVPIQEAEVQSNPAVLQLYLAKRCL